MGRSDSRQEADWGQLSCGCPRTAVSYGRHDDRTTKEFRTVNGVPECRTDLERCRAVTMRPEVSSFRVGVALALPPQLQIRGSAAPSS